jgi:hypothetical protein
MIVNSSQNIQSNNPLGSSATKRVDSASRSSNPKTEDNKQVEKAQKQQNDVVLRQLRARDREVRTHEAAHVAAGGSLVRSGPSYSFQTGPDGRSYAVGGEVQLDVSSVANDPQATLGKANQIRAAALAPANPSPQDLRVAANANQLSSRARVDIAIQRREESQLDENQQTIDNVAETSESESDSDATESTSASSDTPDTGLAVSAPTSNARSSNLQSSDQPVAAISAFMATAQTESVPVRFNQFA